MPRASVATLKPGAMEERRASRHRLRLLLAVAASAAVATAAAAAVTEADAASAPLRGPDVEAKGNGYVGDTCGNGTGVCRVITNCQAALDALERQERPIICSHNQFTPIVCCPYEGKAARMCHKYGEAVWKAKKTFSIIPQTIWSNQCAVKGVPFIVGGVNASSNEFPHMALIGYGDNMNAPEWLCGGSLISKRFVMTAAHCLQTGKGQPRWVRLGELNLATEKERNRYEDYEVELRIAHPDYVDNVHYNDIALLRLNKDVTFTASIRPACIYAIPEMPERELIASGWGYTDWASQENSDQLMKAKLPVQGTEVCQSAYKTLSTTTQLGKGINEQTMLCAGALEGGTDTCRGDSGGPLQLKLSAPYCMYGIVGVTSFGKYICGGANSPAVYTRVSHYVPWIESVAWATDE